jgi:hypothetical protein
VCIEGIWKKTFIRFVHDFKDMDKKEVAKINMSVVEMASDFNLAVHNSGTEELLEVATEELTNELLDLGQEHTGKELTRTKETVEEVKEEPLRKFRLKV